MRCLPIDTSNLNTPPLSRLGLECSNVATAVQERDTLSVGGSAPAPVKLVGD